jgi:hypothetical protein
MSPFSYRDVRISKYFIQLTIVIPGRVAGLA